MELSSIFAGIIGGAKSKRALCWSASLKGLWARGQKEGSLFTYRAAKRI
jgi:hypothetical protein